VAGVLATLFADQAAARKPKPPRPVLLVSPLIEERVQDEVEDATFLFPNLDGANLLDSPFLVYALYYHDSLLDTFPKDKTDADPTSRVIAQILTGLEPNWKARYISFLRQAFDSDVEQLSSDCVLPVPMAKGTAPRRRRRRATHQNALDLFAPEGTPVRSMTRGVVLLADSAWMEGDPISSASDRGGNAVIVFDPTASRFYRYCHLSAVTVEAGGLVKPGQTIGLVGHTGRNAAQPGHGRHLHFEVNEYNDGVMRALQASELQALLREL